jgi:hypothetical protein
MTSQFRYAIIRQYLQVIAFEVVNDKFAKQNPDSGLLPHDGLDCIRRKTAHDDVNFHAAILHGSDYMKELRSLRRELSLRLLIGNVLNRFRGADYDRLLDLLNPKTIELLGRYNRDHAAKMLYRIILAQPRFLTYVAMFIWPGAANEDVYAQLCRPIEFEQHHFFNCVDG